MPYKFQKAQGVKDCCKDDRNIISNIILPADPKNLDRLVCRVCGSKHLILHAEPGRLGMVWGN